MDVSIRVVCGTDAMSAHFSQYSIQAKFHFYSDEESLKKGWKEEAKSNIKQTTFLEGILLKSLDDECEYYVY